MTINNRSRQLYTGGCQMAIAEMGRVRFIRVGNATQVGREGAGVVRKIWHALNDLKGKGPIYEKSFVPNYGITPTSDYRFQHEQYVAVFLKNFDLFINPQSHKVTIGINFMESKVDAYPPQCGEVEYHARERIKQVLRNNLPENDVRQINEDRNGDMKDHLGSIKAKIERLKQEARGSNYLSAKIKTIEAEFIEKPYYELILEVSLKSRWER